MPRKLNETNEDELSDEELTELDPDEIALHRLEAGNIGLPDLPG